MYSKSLTTALSTCLIEALFANSSCGVLQKDAPKKASVFGRPPENPHFGFEDEDARIEMNSKEGVCLTGNRPFSRRFLKRRRY